MNSIFLRTENSKTSQSNVYRLNLTNKIQLHDKVVALTSMTCYYNWNNITKSQNNNKYKIFPSNKVPIEVIIRDGSYTIEPLSNYFEFILEKNNLDKEATKIIPNRTINRINIRIKQNYAFEVQSEETRKFLGVDRVRFTAGTSTGLYVPHVETVDNVLVHCNLVYNDYQLDSELLYSFTPNASPGSLLHIHPNEFIYCQCKDTNFAYIEIRLTDQDFRPLTIEDNVTFTLVIKDNFSLVKNVDQESKL